MIVYYKISSNDKRTHPSCLENHVMGPSSMGNTWFPQLWNLITSSCDLWLQNFTLQSCSPRWYLSNIVSLGLPLSPFLHREGPFLLVEVDPKEFSWAYHLVPFSLRKLLLTELGWDYHLILFFVRRNLPQQQLPWRSYPWVFFFLNSYIWCVKEKENLGKILNLEPSNRRRRF